MTTYTQGELDTIAAALHVMEGKANYRQLFSSPDTTRQYLQLKLAPSPEEQFAVIFLDNAHHLIEFSVLFRGTIDACTVPVRPIARLCLQHNAAAVILAHNHPSGSLTPSQDDKRITDRIREALSLFDVRVIDHIIVSTQGAVSFAESGLI